MNWTKRFLLTYLLALAPTLGLAQTLVNCAPAVPCTMSGPAGTGTGEPAWLAFGKINTNFLQVYAGIGSVTYAAGNTGTAPIPNLANGAVQTWTQNSNVVWGAPSNVPAVGQQLTLVVTQNGTGGYSTAWNAVFKNVPPTPAASLANSKAIYVFIWNGTYWSVPDNYSNTPFPYGAIGDGTATDTTAVQACADSGYCYLPPGFTFKVTATINVPTNGTFIGAGMAKSTIQASSVSGPIIQIGTVGSQHPNVTVGNFRLTGNATIGLATNTYSSDFNDIWAAGTYSLYAFSFDWFFGGTLNNLTTTNGGALGSTLTFSGSVGGATSGTISSGANPGNGAYMMVFANGEIRKVTISGSGASWTGVLRAGTINTVAYGGGFFFGGSVNAQGFNTIYTGGNPAGYAFSFIFDDTNASSSSLGSTINGLTAQNSQVGLFVGSNHYSHTFNSPYFENVVAPIVLGSFADLRQASGITINSPQLSSPFSSHPQYSNRVALIDFNFVQSCTINSPNFYPTDVYDAYVPRLVFTGGGSPTNNAWGYLIINAAGVPKAAVLLNGGAGYSSNPTVTVTGGTGGSGTTVTAVQSGGVVTTLALVGPGGGWTNVLAVPVIYTVAANCAINNPYITSSQGNWKWPLYPMISRSSTANTGAGIAVNGDVTWVTGYLGGGYYNGPAATTTVVKNSGDNYHHVATYMNDAASPVPAYSPNSAGTNYFIPTVMP